ncbi:putative reverse transcriptase domain-containing protein [Tanacetum coccineum]
MAPIRRTTRSTPVTTTPPPVADTTTTTSVTSAQLQAMIDQGVTTVLATRDITQNGDDSHTSGTGHRRSGASILFDTGADRSFVSTQFSTLINITPTTLDHGYNVKLADGRIIWVNTVLLGCTLNFLLNHPFHVDLMPVEMGTYDVIIGMDWLTKYQAVIDCWLR